jgi:hypothetical protein
MNSSPALRRTIAATTLTAGTWCLLALTHERVSGDQLARSTGLALLMLLACLWPLHAGPKLNVTLDTAVVVAVVLLLEPGAAMLVAGCGMLAAQVLRRQPGAQVAFNAAQATLQAGAGSTLLLVGGWRQHGMPLRDPLQLALLAGAMLSIYLVNMLLVSGVIALQLGAAMRVVWLEAITVMPWQDLAQIAAGVVLALALSQSGWWALLVVATVAAPLQVGLRRAGAPATAQARCTA